jgi:hypothetical protein
MAKSELEQCINLNELIFKHKWDYSKLDMICAICGNACEKYIVAIHPSEQNPKGGLYPIPGPAYCHIVPGKEPKVTCFCSAKCRGTFNK